MASAAVDVHACVALAHSHANRPPGEGPLCIHCGGHSIRCSREGDEERVALGVHLGASMIGKCFPKHLTVARESLGVGIPELLQKLGGPLDVGEEEGDGSGREVAHFD
jgi:hypothetical protein